MSWSIGGIIVAAATYGYNKRDDQWAWRVPLALQWIFPVSCFLSRSRSFRKEFWQV